MANAYQDFLTRLTQKRKATSEDIEMYRPITFGRTAVQIDDRVFILNSEDENDRIDPIERALAETDNPFWEAVADESPDAEGLPCKVDHRSFQTPIKDQQDRGTCVCFASLANIESIVKREENTEIDLSEQYANWLFMLKEGKNHCDDGMVTTRSARYLANDGVCVEADYPYEDKTAVQTHCLLVPPANIQSQAKYGIGNFALIDDLGLLGPSIKNPQYLEGLLRRDFNIVFGTHVAWGREPDQNGVYDIILDQYGNPLQSAGGHAMLIVGYDRCGENGSLPYFIIKNSWGDDFGVDGYMYLSYDYLSQYAKYGYIVYNIRKDMPTP
jgi:C1A family cysteine protease